MKAIKILLKTVVVIVVLVIVALLALPLWFGPVVKTVANAAVPQVVKTDFHMGHLHLNPYTARFELADLQLSNPTGYSEKYAATLGELTFDAETLSLATDVIHIEEITVKDVFVSVVSGGENKVGNFKQIQYNVAGGKEKYEQAEAEKAEQAKLEELQAKEAAQEKREPEQQAAAKEKGPSKKVIIDKLHISGLKVQLGFLPISVPVAIDLTDIGRKSGGATLEEAWQQIWSGIMKAAGSVGDAAGKAAAAAGKAAAAATKATTEAAGKAADAAGKAAADATKAVGDTAGKATKAAGKAAADATKAVGDTAGKALDAINKLW